MIASDCERGPIPSAGSSLLMHDAPVVDSSFPAIGHHHPRHGDHQPQQRRREEEEGEEESRNVVCESKSRSGTPTTNEGVTDLCRVCAHCKTTKTPLWRSGPAGPKSLCNACGIRYRKKRRRWVDALIREEEKARNNSCQGREEAEAAVLLVALSCGFLFHQHPQPR